MKLTNDSDVVLIGTKTFTERYYRDKTGWLKISARGRTFRMTAEQVLNHVLPALAGVKPGLTIKVEHQGQCARSFKKSKPRTRPNRSSKICVAKMESFCCGAIHLTPRRLAIH